MFSCLFVIQAVFTHEKSCAPAVVQKPLLALTRKKNTAVFSTACVKGYSGDSWTCTGIN